MLDSAVSYAKKKKKVHLNVYLQFLSSGAQVQLVCPGSGGGGEERKGCNNFLQAVSSPVGQ